MPFLLGYAIRLAIEAKIRYGERLVKLHGGIIEVYQILYLEILGLHVDPIFINKHLQNFSNRDFPHKPDPKVTEFL